ncbi:hypothetical protein BMW23_0362 [Bodo saltans virus]|uniref:Uncharacterized protein n=1 Tax=Bodo saltans virus TaxID=2024608 RepID=A0A2H4UU86_9VIRU|nr:hypothetical protein QJ851_gp0354 [Bodo saltans virus]ATZ80417.1 hypothetical protein BMW23_0362 [Bodo saltans virus]
MNQNFMNKINMSKLEQMRKAKSLSDLSMNKEDLTKYIINPIQILKLTQEEKMEIMANYDNKNNTYTNLKNYRIEEEDSDGKIKNIVSKNVIPKEILDLWEKRTNNPYKQILHKLEIEDYTKKKFLTNDDLIIHKTSALDKAADIKILKKELGKLEKLVSDHNKELKAIYSTDKESEFLEKFEYANKYKNRIKYDPKDNTELKEIYKREQKKLSKESKRIDYMMELYMASDDITKDDIEELKKIQEKEEEISNEYKKNLDLFEENDIKEMRKNKVNKKNIENIEIETKEDIKPINKSVLDKYKNRKQNTEETVQPIEKPSKDTVEKPSKDTVEKPSKEPEQVKKSLIDKYKNRGN